MNDNDNKKFDEWTLMKCPNCGSLWKESDFEPTFEYMTLIKCPDCSSKVKPNNKAVISDIL